MLRYSCDWAISFTGRSLQTNATHHREWGAGAGLLPFPEPSLSWAECQLRLPCCLPAWDPKQTMSLSGQGPWLTLSPLCSPLPTQCHTELGTWQALGTYLQRAWCQFYPELRRGPSSKEAGKPARVEPWLWVGDGAAGSLGLDEDVAVLGVQHTLADELLSDGDGDVVGHTQVGEVVQESGMVTAVGEGAQRLALWG